MNIVKYLPHPQPALDRAGMELDAPGSLFLLPPTSHRIQEVREIAGRIQVQTRAFVCNSCESLPPTDAYVGHSYDTPAMMYLWQGKGYVISTFYIWGSRDGDKMRQECSGARNWHGGGGG